MGAASSKLKPAGMRAIRSLAGIDRYSGLIINMHRTGLWKNRYGTIVHPGGYNLREVSPEVGQFIERNEAWQERERASCDRDALWTNYKLMQVWDLFGLYFCCHEPYEDYIEPVPVSYAGKSETRLTMTPLGPYHVKVDPYPFNKRPCNIQLSFKRLPKTSFEDVGEFHREYFQAQNELLRFELL